MAIFLTVLVVLLIIILLFVLTTIRAYVEFDNVSDCNRVKVKIYAFSFIPVFVLKKDIKGEGKKQSIKEKIDMVVNYLIKSKADPIEYAKKEVNKSDKIPNAIKRFDFSKVYLENANLNLCLDFRCLFYHYHL